MRSPRLNVATMVASSWIRSGGIRIVIGLPIASSAVYPKIRSAPAFQVRICPSRVFPMIASSEESTIAARTASTPTGSIAKDQNRGSPSGLLRSVTLLAAEVPPSTLADASLAVSSDPAPEIDVFCAPRDSTSLFPGLPLQRLPPTVAKHPEAGLGQDQLCSG